MKQLISSLAAAVLVVGACGGGDSMDTSTEAAAASTTSMVATTAAPTTTTTKPVTTTTKPGTTTTDTAENDTAVVEAELPEIVDQYIDAVRSGDAQALEALTTGNDPVDIAAELPEIVDRYNEALIAGDADALAALFTEYGALTGTYRLSTPTAIRSTMPAWFRSVDYTDVEHLDLITTGNTVVHIATWSGMSSSYTRDGPPTPFAAPSVTVFQLDDGLIADCRIYFVYDQIVN